MPGIAGIAAPGRRDFVGRMLDKIAHRGRTGRKVIEASGVTLGAVWPTGFTELQVVQPEAVVSRVDEGRFAEARVVSGELVLDSKEELLFYRIFREQFGEAGDLAWMGRTKGAADAT